MLKKIQNFTVIPSSNFKRHHIRFDKDAFHCLLKDAGCKHTRFLQKNGYAKDRKKLTSADWKVLWNEYFNIDAIERTPKNEHCARIQFDNNISTDGVSISFQMERTKTVYDQSEAERLQEIQEKLSNAQQVYGIDTGLRLVYGGVRRNRDGTEDNIRLTNGQYQKWTGYYKREEKRRALTSDIDQKMRAHRESFDYQPGPRSEDYDVYADHILRHFNEAFNAYTQYEYALLDLKQYIATERALDQMASKLIDSKETFVFLGDANLPGSSPAKGYRRTKVRALFEKMGRRRNCTVFMVDEFRTTKLCSMCFRVLEQPKKDGRVNKKYRYYLCRSCVKDPKAKESAGRIHSKKSNRKVTQQRKNRPRPGVRMASKFRRYEKEEVNGRNITWNRDVNAGRNMYYKGMCIFV